jgi:hypothetical protein
MVSLVLLHTPAISTIRKETLCGNSRMKARLIISPLPSTLMLETETQASSLEAMIYLELPLVLACKFTKQLAHKDGQLKENTLKQMAIN